MRHLDDGTLRRLYDDPVAIPERAQHHFDRCARCQEHFRTVVDDAQSATTLLAVPAQRPNAAVAWAAVQRRFDEDNNTPRQWRRTLKERMTTMQQIYGRRLVKPVSSVAIAAALVATLALTPVGSLAQRLLTIFQPQQFTAVPVTPAELQSLPDLRQYGTMTVSGGTGTRGGQTVSSARAAGQAAGFTVRTPASLPADVPATVTYGVMGQNSASFTFSAAKARAAAAVTGKPFPPMPAHIDGSTIRVTAGPFVAAIYGARPRNNDRSFLDSLPTLIVAQGPAPQVTSTGATRAEIESYLLAQPGVSPTLRSEIQQIGNPDTTLPIPVPINVVTAQTIQVQGVNGLAIGDNTGIGSAVIWQKNGMVYGVAGTLTEDEIVRIANSLR